MPPRIGGTTVEKKEDFTQDQEIHCEGGGTTQERRENPEEEDCPHTERDGVPPTPEHTAETTTTPGAAIAYFAGEGDNHTSQSDKSYSTIILGPGVEVTGLIDSGNMVSSAISEQLAKENGLPIRPYAKDGEPTAMTPDGRQLEIIGEIPNLQFTFQGAPNTLFSERVVVIRNLSHQMNLGKAWLTRHKAVHNHGTETVRLKRPNQSGWTTIRLRGEEELMSQPKRGHFVYGNMRYRIPAKSARYIRVNVPSFEQEAEIIITPTEGTSNPGLLAKSITTVKGSQAMAAIFNPLEKDVYIQKWQKLGEAEPVTKDHVLGAMKGWPCAEEAAASHVSEAEEQRRRSWLYKEFRLDESDVLKDDKVTTGQLLDLLSEYYDCISQHKTDYGRTSLMEMEIDLIPGAKPFKGRCLPTNPAEEADLWETLQEWNRQGVTEPANSPWGAPLIPVRKKDGRLRWCVDFRRLNEVTVKDSYPLPLITTNLHKLGNSAIFSTIDGTGAYHNVPIAEQDRPLTAFVSPFGQFQFCRMPFGLSNAPQVYSRLVQLLLQGTDVRHILAYIDDIIVHTSTKHEHLNVLRQVLEAHRRGGLKIAPAKSFLFRSKVDYLGHQVSQGGIEMVNKYVELLLNWPKPTSPKELATFLGKAGYYRSFIKDYGKIVACLEAEKKKPTLIWTPKMDQAFETVKRAFREKPILAYPDYQGVHEGRPFIMDSDWCGTGMAQQISQVQPGPDGVRERVIAFRGRKNTQAESNYSSNKGETASFVDGLEGFEHMLRYAPFKARVDNRCLSYIRNLKKPKGIWWRWLDLIQSFNFDIEHRPGKKHGNVDSLSRAPHLPEPTEEQEKRSASYLCTLTDDQLRQVDVLNQETLEEIDQETLKGEENRDEDVTLPLSNQQIRQAQRDDPDVRRMMDWVGKGRKPDKSELKLESLQVQTMMRDYELFNIKQGVLFRSLLENESKAGLRERLVLPRSLLDKAFYWMHAHPTAGHMGMKATQQRMRSRFYFPGLYNWVEKQVIGCHACIKKRGPTRAVTTPSNIQRGHPGARWSLDLVGPLPETHNGNSYIMTAEDNFCRWPVAVAIPDRTAETVAKAFASHVIAEYGSCQQLLTDNAAELTGHIIKDVAKILNIRKVETVPYNPNGNKVERWHRTLGEMLRATVDLDQRNWDEALPECLLAYRTSVHATTKMTPFFLMHGREADLPVDLIFARPPQDYELATEYGKELTDRLDAAYSFVRDNQKKVIKRQIQKVNDQTKAKPFEVGDLVWYYSPRQNVGTSRKLHRGWTGPFKIGKVISEVMYMITPSGDWTDKRPSIPAVIHRMIRYEPDTALPTPRVDITEEELIQELVDQVDENLESTDEVVLAICPEQQPTEKVKVQIPTENDVDVMVDVATGRDHSESGRAAEVDKISLADKISPTPMLPDKPDTHDELMVNLDKDLREYFGFDEVKDEIMAENEKEKEEIIEPMATEGSNTAGDEDRTESTDSRTTTQQNEQRASLRRSSRTAATSGPFAPPEQPRHVEAAYKTTSTRSLRTSSTPIPTYMTAAARGASVTPDGGTKRPREEDTEISGNQKTLKQSSTSQVKGFNTMTNQMAKLQISIPVGSMSGSGQRTAPWRREREPEPLYTDLPGGVPGGPGFGFVGDPNYRGFIGSRREENERTPARLLEIPYHRIVQQPGSKMPVRGSINAAGYDCFAYRDIRIGRGLTAAVNLGFSLAPSAGVYCRLAETGSWAMERPMFILRAGVIDPDYRGPVVALVTYMGPEEWGYINKGERICQLVPTCFRGDPFHALSALPRTGRGVSGGYQRYLDETAIDLRRERGPRAQPEGGQEVAMDREANWKPMCREEQAAPDREQHLQLDDGARSGMEDGAAPVPSDGGPVLEDSPSCPSC